MKINISEDNMVSQFSCLSWLVIVLIWICDITMMICAVSAHVLYMSFWPVVEGDITTVPIMLITVASLRMFLGLARLLYQCMCSKRAPESKANFCTSVVFKAFFVATVLTQLAGAIIAVQNMKYLDDVTNNLSTQYNSTTTDAESLKLIGDFQMTAHCCGFYGPDDFEKFNWPDVLHREKCCTQPPCYVIEFPNGCNGVVREDIIYYNTFLAVVGFLVPGGSLVFILGVWWGIHPKTSSDEDSPTKDGKNVVT